jgi:hypothetical protein
MEYDVDVPLGDVLRWVKEDAAKASPRLWVRASKEYGVAQDFKREEAGIGEDEDLEPVVVSGCMEISPRRGRGGWTLLLRFEDSVGLRPAGEDAGYEDDDDLTIEAFEEECIRPERGELEIVVSVESADAKARFDRWLARHKGPPRATGRPG